MKYLHSILTLLFCGVAIVVSGCGTNYVASGQQRVIVIAEETLRKHNLKPEDYKPPEVHYDTKDHCWGVLFWPKSPVWEGDVQVIIDDKTGKVVRASQGFTPLK